MQWPRLSAEVLPLLTTISPLIGVVTTLVMARWNAALVRPMACSNSAMTLLLVGAAVWFGRSTEFRDHDVGANHHTDGGIAWLADPAPESISAGKLRYQGLNVRLAFAMDGLAAWPALIISLTVWSVLCSPGRSDDQAFSSRCAWLMSSQALLLASLFATDVIAGLVFFEVSLVPVYFLLGICGDEGRRPVADSLWTLQMIGGSCSLLGTTLLAVSQPWMQADMDLSRSPLTFDSALLADSLRMSLAGSESAWHLWNHLGPWGVLALLIGFLIRLPAFPFQGSYQTALTTAPADVSALIAAAFPLVAFTGWLRVGMPLLAMDQGPLVVVLGVVSLIGVLQTGYAMRHQSDLKQFIAMVSCTVLGLACLGLSCQTEDGLQGAWLMMLSHGLSVAGGMRLVQFPESRGYPRDITRIAEFAGEAPRFRAILTLFLLGWTGIPLLFGFSALYLQLSGSAAAAWWIILGESAGMAAIAAAAIRLVSASRRAHFGESFVRRPSESEPDLTGSELAGIIPYVVLLVLLNAAPLVLMNNSDSILKSLFRKTSRHTTIQDRPRSGMPAPRSFTSPASFRLAAGIAGGGAPLPPVVG